MSTALLAHYDSIFAISVAIFDTSHLIISTQCLNSGSSSSALISIFNLWLISSDRDAELLRSRNSRIICHRLWLYANLIIAAYAMALCAAIPLSNIAVSLEQTRSEYEKRNDVDFAQSQYFSITASAMPSFRFDILMSAASDIQCAVSIQRWSKWDKRKSSGIMARRPEP